MLGQMRNRSTFSTESTRLPVPDPTITADMPFTNAPLECGTADQAELAFVPRPLLNMGSQPHTIFSEAVTESRDFQSVLAEVQSHISINYSGLIGIGSEDAKDQMKRHISKFIRDQHVTVEGMSHEQLVDAVYIEMAEFSFLTKYLTMGGVEEIDINSWRDIEVQYSSGDTVKLEEHFDSPEHAINVIRRMLHVSGMVLDNASPNVLGHLAKNVRIAVLKSPIVDDDVGIAASIRIVNPQNMTKADFISAGTATEPMLDFLAQCVRYGISVCVAGATSSGKTTLLGWILSTIPVHKRIFTIETGSRELNAVRERDGKVVNSVIHTLTRDSDIERQRVDQIDLLDMGLRFNPDLVVVGEMRGPEANAAQEAARTGIGVLSSIHSNSCGTTYLRMVSLCNRAVDQSEQTLMGYVTEAFPIVVFCKQLENRQRRLMEIQECEILDSGARKYRSLFRYVISESRMENDSFIINGYHEQVNPISDSLAKRLLENGMPQELINQLKRSCERL